MIPFSVNTHTHTHTKSTHAHAQTTQHKLSRVQNPLPKLYPIHSNYNRWQYAWSTNRSTTPSASRGEPGVGTPGGGVAHRGRLLELDFDAAARGVLDGLLGLVVELVVPQVEVGDLRLLEDGSERRGALGFDVVPLEIERGHGAPLEPLAQLGDALRSVGALSTIVEAAELVVAQIERLQRRVALEALRESGYSIRAEVVFSQIQLLEHAVLLDAARDDDG